MIDFSFEPRADDPAWSPGWQPERPELNSSDFCLRYFMADLRLIIHGTDLSVHLLGEPVVDLALMLDYATRTLEKQNEIAVEASLTQHVYSFTREADNVTLTTTWPSGAVAQLTWPELQQLTETAKAEAVRLIVTAHPELRGNTWLRQTVGEPPA